MSDEPMPEEDEDDIVSEFFLGMALAILGVGDNYREVGDFFMDWIKRNDN